jgi:hypothetical protein
MTGADRAARRAAALPAAALVAATLVAGRAGAQTLDLDPATRPPEIGDRTFVVPLVDELEAELETLIRRDRRADGVERTLLRASIHCRRLAVDLLLGGETAGPAGSVAVLHGVRLASGRADLDAALEALGGRDPAAPSTARALRLVARFHETPPGLDAAIDDRDPAALDRRLAECFAPLGEAIVILDGAPLADHWLHAADAGASDGGPAGTDLAAVVDGLAARLDDAGLPASTATPVRETIEFLGRGLAFSELRSRVVAGCRAVSTVLDVADTIAGAAWLGDAPADRYLAEVAAAAAGYRAPDTRAAAAARLEELEAVQVVVQHLGRLRAAREDVRPLMALLARLDAPEHAAGRRWRLELLASILEGMADFRALSREPPPPGRDLPQVHRRLRRTYLDAEAALLRELARRPPEDVSLADPAFASQLGDLRQLLGDLRRLHRVSAWVETVAAIAPEAEDALATRLRRLAARLLDPQRRAGAVEQMDRFEAELARFARLPFEDDLAAGTPAAVAATGGQHRALLERIETARRAWAVAWSGPEPPGPASRRLELLARLASAMLDLATAADTTEAAGTLNRWAAWDMPAWAMARPLTDVAGRLKLGAAAAVEGDDDELAAQLDRMDADAPLVRVVGGLLRARGEALAALPDGARSLAGQVVHGPTPGAWLADRRPEIARLCRYATELVYAQRTNERELVDALGPYVAGLCDDLLPALR